jgi:inner membrane protein involved in colicin E2 resistance
VILEYIAIGLGEAVISFIPLLVVVGISMIKDIIEDRARYLSD